MDDPRLQSNDLLQDFSAPATPEVIEGLVSWDSEQQQVGSSGQMQGHLEATPPQIICAAPVPQPDDPSASANAESVAVASWLSQLKDGQKCALFRTSFLPEHILKRKITCKLSSDKEVFRVILDVSNWGELSEKWNRRKRRDSRDTNTLKKAFESTLYKSKAMKQKFLSPPTFSELSHSVPSRTLTLAVSREVFKKIFELRPSSEEDLKMRIKKMTSGFQRQGAPVVQTKKAVKTTKMPVAMISAMRGEPHAEQVPSVKKGKSYFQGFPLFFGCEPAQASAGVVEEFTIQSDQLFVNRLGEVELKGEKGGEKTFPVVSTPEDNLAFHAVWSIPESVEVMLRLENFQWLLGRIRFMSRGESSNEDSSSTRVPTSSTLTSQGLAPSLPLKLAETKSVITVLASGKSKLSEGVCHYQRLLYLVLPNLHYSNFKGKERILGKLNKYGFTLLSRLLQKDQHLSRMFIRWLLAFGRGFLNRPLGNSKYLHRKAISCAGSVDLVSLPMRNVNYIRDCEPNGFTKSKIIAERKFESAMQQVQHPSKICRNFVSVVHFLRKMLLDDLKLQGVYFQFVGCELPLLQTTKSNERQRFVIGGSRNVKPYSNSWECKAANVLVLTRTTTALNRTDTVTSLGKSWLLCDCCVKIAKQTTIDKIDWNGERLYFVKKVKSLINAGMDFITKSLWKACPGDYVEMAELLINAGACVNTTDSHGRGPLWAACSNGHLEIAKLLIDAGAKVNNSDGDKTPLLIACVNGQVEIAKLLINAGADINKMDEKKNSVLHVFMKCRRSYSDEHLDFLDFILSKDVSLVDCCGEDNLLPHEYLCPTEVRRFLFESWIKYRYNKLYSQGTTKAKRIKVCVIGDARAGKTSLIKSLRNIYWKKRGYDCRTASINLSKSTIKSAGEMVFCDFAGQLNFHKTHGLFFSESTTVFLLVVDLAKSNWELQASSFYFCSVAKCSVGLTKLRKASVIVIGSRKDELQNLENEERKLGQLVLNLRKTYSRWLNFYENEFVLNCRERSSKALDLLRQVETLVTEMSKDVPLIVEAAVTSFLPTLRHPFQSLSPTEQELSFFSRGESKATKEIRQKTLSSLRRKSLIPYSEEDRCYTIRMMDARVFKQLLVDSVWPDLSDQALDLLVDFLQGIGEILVFENKIILDRHWLCQSAIGPLLSTTESSKFSLSLQCSSPGTVTKEEIQYALEAFNNEKWENINEAISLLCHLEICYPLDEPDTYRFPALLDDERPPEVWSENLEMKIYVGRRLRQAEETDIITPGTMPFLQCHVQNAACFSGLKPVIWKGGLMIRETIDGLSVEGMISLQQKDKAMDFVVRGPEHSEKECMKFLTILKETGEKVLSQRSPGTNTLYFYISSAELKQLKDFPLAYAEDKVNKKIKTSTKSNVSVSEGTTTDSLKDLLALPDNHIDFLSYKARCAIITCLSKDCAGRKALKERLQGLSQADKAKCSTAARLLFTWSEYLCATAESLADAARQSSLLYLLSLLNAYGSVRLSTEEKSEAEKDLNFLQTSSPSQLKRRFVGKAASTAREGKDVHFQFNNVYLLSLFNDEFLDKPMTPQERFRAAQQIQSKWSNIGRILGPEPFEPFEIYAFGERRSDNDGALQMLDAWANKFDTRATRRHFINAIKNPEIGCSTEVAAIFSGLR